MTEILVRCYGRLAEEAQREFSVAVPAGGLTVGTLRKQLAQQFGAPRLLDPLVRAAVRDELVQEEAIVRPGEEVDFLAPLSGG